MSKYLGQEAMIAELRDLGLDDTAPALLDGMRAGTITGWYPRKRKWQAIDPRDIADDATLLNGGAIGTRPGGLWQMRLDFCDVCYEREQVIRALMLSALTPEQGPDVPAPSAAEYRSGAAGRPSSRQLVEHEMRARADRGEIKSSLTEEAADLATWLTTAHPTAPPMTSKTIANVTRKTYNALRPKS
jgi:hypothetical protein